MVEGETVFTCFNGQIMEEATVMIAYKALITPHSETTRGTGTPHEWTISPVYICLSIP